MRLGSTGLPRMIFLKYPDHDTRILFTARVLDDETVSIQPDASELETIGVTTRVIDELFLKAQQAVDAERNNR